MCDDGHVVRIRVCVPYGSIQFHLYTVKSYRPLEWLKGTVQEQGCYDGIVKEPESLKT